MVLPILTSAHEGGNITQLDNPKKFSKSDRFYNEGSEQSDYFLHIKTLIVWAILLFFTEGNINMKTFESELI